MNYTYTVLGVRRALEQIVQNLDAQVEQLTQAATEADAKHPSATVPTDRHHRDLLEAFHQLANARAGIVNAHGEISATVPAHVTQTEPLR
jgi:hypothetical protein